MSVRVLTVATEPTSPSPRYGQGFSKSTGGSSAYQDSRGRPSHHRHTELAEPARSSEVAEQYWISSHLIEALPQGVMVVARNLQPMLWNSKAKRMCQTVLSTNFPGHGLPTSLLEVCHRLIRESCLAEQSIVMEFQTSAGSTVRISARWLEGDSLLSGHAIAPNMLDDYGQATSAAHPHQTMRQTKILLVLEDCDEALKTELRIQQQKYDLTEREAEIWMLLRQEYTYQEIASKLQISLNTVKTHVKNVYAKKRSRQGQEKFWCCD